LYFIGRKLTEVKKSWHNKTEPKLKVYKYCFADRTTNFSVTAATAAGLETLSALSYSIIISLQKEVD
jgi:hypothetical protein